MHGPLTILTSSAEETERLAEVVGRVVGVGDVLLLEGELGAGKTAFVRGLAGGLGHDRRVVSSPTFVVLNRYVARGAITLVHMDAYRLSGGDELETVGWEHVVDADGVLAVEWPSRVGDRLGEIDPRRVARVLLEHTGAESRRITIAPPENWTRRPGFGGLLTLAGRRVATTCPATGVPVPMDSPSWPFASERARLADLHRWLTGGYVVSRELQEGDEQG